MESVAIVVLLVVLGGGGLLIALIYAIISGSARSERLARLEREQTTLRMGLHVAHERIAQLQGALGEAMRRIDWLRAQQQALPASAETPQAAAEAPQGSAEMPQASVEPSQASAEMRQASAEPSQGSPETPAQVAPEAPQPPAAGPAIPIWSTPPAESAARPPEPEPEPEPQPEPDRSPPPPPPAVEPPPPAPPPPPRFDWERWVGVRGAAALGACILVIAGLYFFKYSIEHGLISPALRVVLGTLVGLGGVGASELMLRRKYTVLANWLAGAGVAILYTSFWAAHALYGLVGSAPSFALMTLVTVACGMLAQRHDAIVIALLGLLGGFVTPVALSSGEDHPIGLFGYLLLLDGALLYLAVRRRWAILGALSLLGTAFYQVAWIGARMGPDRVAMGMGIVVVFGALYGVSLPAPSAEEGPAWKLTRAATVLLPYTFGLYFGLRGDLGEHLAPLGVMLALLSAGAAWMARSKRGGWIAQAAAIADVAVIGAWIANHDHAAIAWEVAGIVAGLGVVFHAFRELDRARPSAGGPAAVAALGGLFLLVLSAAAPSAHDPWPWLVGWLVLGGLALRQSVLGSPALRLGVALLIDLGVPVVHAVHLGDASFPAQAVYQSGILVVTALAALSAYLLRRDARARAPAGTDAWVVLAPFAFALYFAVADAGPHLVPLGVMVAALVAAAAWAGRAAAQVAWIALGATASALGVLAVWLGVHDASAFAWEAAGIVALVAAVPHAFGELSGSDGVTDAVAAIGGSVLLLAAASGRSASVPWPFVAGALALSALVLRQARLAKRARLHLAPAVVLGVGLPAVHAAHVADASFPPAGMWLAPAVMVALGVQAHALQKREGQGRRWAAHGAALLALLLLADAFVSDAPPALVLVATAVLLAIALVSAARLGHGGWAFAAALAGAFVQTGYVLARIPDQPGGPSAALVAVVGQLVAVVLVAAWPVAAARRLSADAWAWRAAALAGPLWFGGLYVAWTTAFGRGFVGLLPLTLGAVTAAVATRAQPVLPREGAVRRSALVWLFAVTLCSVSVAIPLQLENEWITVGWALEGLALAALWQRMDHAGLKYTAATHLGAVAVRLVANPAVLDYHTRGALPVFNWLLYTYWIPTAALLGAWWLLRAHEAARARPWEAGLYAKGRPVLASAAAAAAIVVFFVWINLTIFDAFGAGPALHLAFERLPARDLTLSLAWAVYALGLLGLGMARRSAALRWTSLALIIVTAGKVFLYDLSHLHDLYRVMSLVGLAFSLIFISLAYQRFVFGRREDGET